MRGMRRAMGAAVLLGVLTVAACTPGPPEAAPPPLPTPSLSQSPSETPQERQERLDYAAAEKSYRTFRAEYNRVLRAGGAKEPTNVMKATAGGDYLAEFVEITQAYKGLNGRDTGEERIVYVRTAGYEPTAIALKVCEDGRRIATLSGKKRIPGELRTANLEVRKVRGDWKVWSGTGRKVATCA